VGVRETVGVNSGTDAIALTLRALEVGPGDEVITVSHTAVATVAAIEQAGATPVLVDVDPGTLTMDVEQARAVITPSTRAVIPIHLYGNVSDVHALRDLCESNNLVLIEDCSQAHGALVGGDHVGTVGVAGVFSCYPTKNLGALGDAGLITTNDPELARRLRRIRQYGWEARNQSLEVGVNSRLDEVQAAVLRVKLAHLDDDIRRRREIARRYDEALPGSGLSRVGERPDTKSAYHLYVIRTSERDSVAEHLNVRGIDTAIHYPFPIHRQPAYSGRVKTGPRMTQSENAATTVLSLPMYPQLDVDDVARVAQALSEWRSP
jgi:dTDP-4-amino-4,6-dideoxygalactose transaminase